MSVMEEVGMVNKDLDWFFGSKKEMSPIGQSEYES
jgi:hypothetical protein